MKALLFNMHDVVLLLTAGACLLLGVLQFKAARRCGQRQDFLSLFLLTTGLVSVHTLVYWAEPLRHQLFDAFPQAYLLLSTTAFLLGPLLFWHVGTVSLRPFKWSPKQWWHLLPALLAPVYLYWVCFRFDSATQRVLFLDMKLYNQPGVFYQHYISAEKLLPLIYGLLALWMVIRASRSDEGAGRQATWHSLRVLVGGFTVIWSWAAVTHFWGWLHPGGLSDLMGIAGNYLRLGLVVYLIYDFLMTLTASRPEAVTGQRSPSASAVSVSGGTGLELLASRDTVSPESAHPGQNSASATLVAPEPVEPEPQVPSEAHARLIVHAMETDRVFLNSQLTLERFADTVGLPSREVSAVINRRFDQNFHEFINAYRVEEAKKMLSDPLQMGTSIQDIAQASGFNSKATFHRFFKQHVAMTPSAYRRQQVQRSA